PNGQNLNAQTFGKSLFEAAENGNFWLGGCCETTPDFIRELALFYQSLS
ncbi:homocysteine S-methyltransferase family protein, partial [bacterium]|nr:homocysteine S-methyltransferase family protein [bacterium]